MSRAADLVTTALIGLCFTYLTWLFARFTPSFLSWYVGGPLSALCTLIALAGYTGAYRIVRKG